MGQQRIKHAHKTKELKGTKSFIDKSSEDLFFPEHIQNHFPTEEEKVVIMADTGISAKQFKMKMVVSNLYCNTFT